MRAKRLCESIEPFPAYRGWIDPDRGERVIAELTPAFVLHSYAYRDSSAVLELFTLSAGRVGVVAKGARGSRSRIRALLQPFVPLLVSWHGRGELGSLRSIEERDGRRSVPPGRLPCAFYLNELMVKLLERDEPMPRLFQHYENALAGLCRSESENVALRKFERELMTELGVGLVLNRDSHGRHLDPKAWYRYQIGAGPMRVPETAAGMQGCVSGRSLLAFARDELNDARVLRDARTITRQAVEEQLGGRPLRSRELLYAPPAGLSSGSNQNSR